MSIPEIILTVIAAVILAASAVCTVSWLIALRSAKENAFVFSLSNLVKWRTYYHVYSLRGHR